MARENGSRGIRGFAIQWRSRGQSRPHPCGARAGRFARRTSAEGFARCTREEIGETFAIGAYCFRKYFAESVAKKERNVRSGGFDEERTAYCRARYRQQQDVCAGWRNR